MSVTMSVTVASVYVRVRVCAPVCACIGVLDAWLVNTIYLKLAMMDTSLTWHIELSC